MAKEFKLGDMAYIQGIVNLAGQITLAFLSINIKDWTQGKHIICKYPVKIIGICKTISREDYNCFYQLVPHRTDVLQYTPFDSQEDLDSYYMLPGIKLGDYGAACDFDVLLPVEEELIIKAQDAKPQKVYTRTSEQFEKDKRFFFPDLCKPYVAPEGSGLKYL